MKSMNVVVVCLFVFLLASSPALAASKDAKGCKDSPVITRFPGSVITQCEEKGDEAYGFHMPNDAPAKTIEGQYQKLEYHYPEAASKAEVVRNIHTALENAGFTFDYDSGSFGDMTAHAGTTWIWESVSRSHNYEQVVVKQIVLKQEMVANAKAMMNGIAAAGHAAVYGILFDTGKADIKPKSAPALEEITKLLKNDPKLKLYVVGHTDNVGSLSANMMLSRKRAAAVVHALTAKYGISASRLAPYGDGPYAPVASNDSKAGRALNRRVDLVKQ